MGLKLVLLVAVTNHTEAAVCSTNHMLGNARVNFVGVSFPALTIYVIYLCILPRLQAPGNRKREA